MLSEEDVRSRVTSAGVLSMSEMSVELQSCSRCGFRLMRSNRDTVRFGNECSSGSRGIFARLEMS